MNWRFLIAELSLPVSIGVIYVVTRRKLLHRLRWALVALRWRLAPLLWAAQDRWRRSISPRLSRAVAHCSNRERWERVISRCSVAVQSGGGWLARALSRAANWTLVVAASGIARGRARRRDRITTEPSRGVARFVFEKSRLLIGSQNRSLILTLGLGVFAAASHDLALLLRPLLRPVRTPAGRRRNPPGARLLSSPGLRRYTSVAGGTAVSEAESPPV